jgi:uncharacterized membrane protein YedE/YeeE
MIDWDQFTPIASSIGGAMIGASAVMLMAFNGRIAGISGMVHGSIRATASERAWRGAFVLGLVLGAAALTWTGVAEVPVREGFPIWALVLAGLAVGAGTRLGSGCTSGHGICGIARLSQRSIVATMMFVLVAILTNWVLRHGLGVLT